MDIARLRPHPRPPISPLRKILCICLAGTAAGAAFAGVAMARPGAPRSTAPDLLAATLTQAGRKLIFSARTARPLPLKRLEATPRVRRGGRYLCFEVHPAGRSGARRVCLDGAGKSRRRAGLELLNASGGATRATTIPATVTRPRPDKLVLALAPDDAGLQPHRYRWRAIENRAGCVGCGESLPADGLRAFRLRPVRAVGCTGGNAGLVTNGPRGRPVVALTFDDGPSEYTEGFLDVLRAKHAVGTFFEIGQEVAGRTDVMRRMLREGDEIGNHTMHHDFYPGYSDLVATSHVIRAATHFQPCLFRPPGGGYNSAVIAAAGEAQMKTVTWDVDPVDWSTPGSAAVYSRVVGATQPGSIILMHDGGGNRSDTLAALPSIIETLRGRGYRFATVSALLGNHLVYRPYG